MEKKTKKQSGLIKLILMVILSCVTQVISLMKSSIVAGAFGASDEMDSFNFANSIATFVFSFVTAGVSTIVIPCYVKKINTRNTNSFLTTVFAGITIVVTVILLLRFPIISTITGRDYEFVCLSSSVLIVLIVSNLFSIFTSVTAAYFQYAEKYNLPKIIMLFSQIFVVIFLTTFKEISVFQYALIVGVGIVVNSLIDVVFALKLGWRYKPALAVNESGTKELFNTFLPIMFSTGVYQLSLIIDSSIASRLNSGDITVLNYANQISSMINALLVNNLLVYFYPKLVRDVEQNKEQRCFWEKTYFFHAIICLVVAGYAVIGREGVSLLFEHGKFNAQAVNSVFMLSLVYIVGQPMNVIRDLIYRYFYAYSDTKSATVNSAISTVVNIIASIILVRFIGLYGIVIGTVVSSIVSLFFIMVKFKDRFGYKVRISNIVIQYLKTTIITFVTILFVVFTQQMFCIDNKVLSIVIYGIEVIITYVMLTLIFNRKIKRIALQI